jgi:uncharacterized protein YjiS (DUF1127 family)
VIVLEGCEERARCGRQLWPIPQGAVSCVILPVPPITAGFAESKYVANEPANGANMISLTIGRIFSVEPSCQCKLRSLFDGWRDRVWSRFALQRLSERDLADMGLTRLDLFEEAQKPFWQE